MSCYRPLALCSIACDVYCQERSSLAVETYLLRPIGARTAGMSNMHVASADDPTALFSNPASIGYLRDSTMITTGTTLLSFGRSLSNIALSHPISRELTIGAGIVSMIAGTLTHRDLNGTIIGTQSIWQGFSSIAASYHLTTTTSLGIGGRVFLSSSPDASSRGSGVALDLGAVTSIFDLATFGISVQQIGVMSFGSERFSLPWMLRLGLSSRIPFQIDYVPTTSTTLGSTDTVEVPSIEHLLVGFEAQLRAGAKTPTFIIGAEVIPYPFVAVRGGIALYGESHGVPKLYPATTFSGGISLSLPLSIPIRLDYALS